MSQDHVCCGCDQDRQCALCEHLTEVINVTWNYAGRITSTYDEVINAALGLGGESGEVLDVLKKGYFHSLDKADRMRGDLVLEMGDVMYYWLKLADLFDLSVDEILATNREKLFARKAARENAQAASLPRLANGEELLD